MSVNQRLAIAIPTYNRADFLDYSLEVHIPIMQAHSVPIYISDNASTDHTKDVVEKWQQVYPYIYYHRNDENLGPDKNFEIALKMPATDYVWLLGDTYKIPDSGVSCFFSTIDKSEQNFDVVVFNLADKIVSPTNNYTDKNKLLSDLGAVMTCAAVNVYNKKLIDSAEFTRYFQSYFVQTGIIFEYISDIDFNIIWIKEYSIDSLNPPTLSKKNWSHSPKVFEIGCESWMNFVMSLPSAYRIVSKMKCIMDFGKVSGVFLLKNLIILRAMGLLNFKVFNRYKMLFPFTVNYPLFLIFFIAITPKIVFKNLITVFIFMFRRSKIEKIDEIFGKNYK